MSKPTLRDIENEINRKKKNVMYTTREFPIEFLHSKFKRKIEYGKNREIFIPFYQRKFVWSEEKQSKFIESIILNFPIPPMILADMDDGTFEVIDGSQRIRTICAFLDNELKLKKLKKLNILNGFTFNDLSQAIKRKIINVSIRAIVIDIVDREDFDIRHEVFERVNSGIESLKKMEIKKGEGGNFIEAIFDECAKDKEFQEIGKFTEMDNKRGYTEEFLLKYFAFSDNLEFENTIEEYLDNYIEQKNKLNYDEIKNQYLIAFENMLSFVKSKNLAKDISINRKNRLLAIFIAVTLALRKNPNLLKSEKEYDMYDDEFINNAKSSSFVKLKENIEHLKNILLG